MHVLFHLDLTTMIALTRMLVHSLSVAIKRSIMVTEVAEARTVCTEKTCLKEQQPNLKIIGSVDKRNKNKQHGIHCKNFYFMKITQTQHGFLNIIIH